jgi:leucyl-tRNA synthetase
MTYGTGAIMAVPAHDERDWDFAKKFGLPIIEVVSGSDTSVEEKVYTDVATGTLVNSGFLNGLSVADAKAKIIEYLEEKGIGSSKTNFKLRDWVFSRQRYWGEPIPIVHCDKCGYVPLDESELPLELPDVESYMPTDNGESPLAAMTDWVNTTCPCCGGPAKRETDTMPQWAGSSWYFLRYTDPHNSEALASKEALDYWMPVDWYNGGMEHTTLHLLYSRFWHKFLYDEGVVPCPEPYQKRTSHGMILGANGEKMSKSRGNVVNPDDIVRDYGADTLRTYEMFIGAFDLSAAWSEDGVKGCRRFLERVWKLQDILVDGDGYSADMETKIHQTIKKVSNDYENLKYNTAIAAMMSLINDFYKKNSVTKGEYKTLLTLLNPVAPHITEELWQTAGYEGRLYQTAWPEYDEAKTVESTIEVAVQVNGKLRLTIKVSKDEEKDNVIAAAKEALGSKLNGTIVKEIYVPGKIVNIVVKP